MALKHLPKLMLNHVDAWGITLMIGIVALVIHQPFRIDMLGVPVILAFCYWLGFAVNDYFDAPFDSHDAKKGQRNFFVQVPISRLQAAVAFAIISGILGIAFAHFGLRGVVVVISGMFAIWAYSAPPLRLKSRPGFDLLMHMIFVQTFPYIACMTLIGFQWTLLDTALISIFVLTSFSAQLEQQIRDYAVDMETDRNFTTTVGAPTSAFLLKLSSGTLIILFTYYALVGIIPVSLLPFGLLFLPLLLHRFFRGALAARPELLGRIMLAAALLYTGYVSTSGLFGLR